MEQNTPQLDKEKTLNYFLDIVAREVSFGRCNYGEFEKERLDVISNFEGDSKEIYYYEHFGLIKIQLDAHTRFHTYQIEQKDKAFQKMLDVKCEQASKHLQEIQSLKEQLEEERKKLNEIHVLNYLSKRLSAEGDLVEQWGEFFNESGFKISNEYLLEQFKQQKQ